MELETFRNDQLFHQWLLRFACSFYTAAQLYALPRVDEGRRII